MKYWSAPVLSRRERERRRASHGRELVLFLFGKSRVHEHPTQQEEGALRHSESLLRAPPGLPLEEETPALLAVECDSTEGT